MQYLWKHGKLLTVCNYLQKRSVKKDSLNEAKQSIFYLWNAFYSNSFYFDLSKHSCLEAVCHLQGLPRTNSVEL